MIFSLILCSLDRQALVTRCLNSLFEQSFKDFEIILVDQSDNPYSFSQAILNRIKYCHVDKKGLSRARNYAVTKASGNYLCLIDDDAVYDRDYLKNAYAHLSKNNFSIIGGRMIDNTTNRTKMNKKVIKIGWRNSFKYLVSPSMIIKKEILIEHPFDERFGVGSKYGCGEESDIVLFCLSKGGRICCFNDFVVYHPIGTKGSVERIYNYSIGHGALFYKAQKQYSFFWGTHFYVKSIVGNFLKACFSIVLFNRTKFRLANARMKGVARGYKIFRKNETFFNRFKL